MVGPIAVAVSVVVAKVAGRHPRSGASVSERRGTGSLVPAWLLVRFCETRTNDDDDVFLVSEDGSRGIDSTLARQGSMPKWGGSRRFPMGTAHLVGPTSVAVDMGKHSPLLLNGFKIGKILKNSTYLEVEDRWREVDQKKGMKKVGSDVANEPRAFKAGMSGSTTRASHGPDWYADAWQRLIP